MKYFFRRIILVLLNLLYFFIKPLLSKPEVAVLMYHSVADTDWFFSVSPKVFERQMRYLKHNSRIVTPYDILDFISGKTIAKKSVAITFDDGYKDFLIHALPVINKYQIPVTLFVSMGEVARNELGNNFELLSRGELQNMQKNKLVTMGSHALTHKKLTKINMREAQEEIMGSEDLLKNKIGAQPDFFAYPKGSYNDFIKGLVRSAGYRGGFGADPYLVARNTDRYAIPRIQIDQSTNFFEFKTKITAVTNWYYWLWKKLKPRFLF